MIETEKPSMYMDTPTHIVLSQLILELVENLLEKCPPVIKHVSQVSRYIHTYILNILTIMIRLLKKYQLA